MEVIRFAGDSAIQISFDREIFPSTVDALKSQLAKLPVVDVVSTYRAITVYFDPLKVPSGELIKELEKAQFVFSSVQTGNLRRIEMCVCPECALDSAAVPGFDRFIDLYCRQEYTVRFLGFQPGFPFCDGLPAELSLPRMETPRIRVPAGSVGIGGVQTGIYVFPAPGGWRIIGRTKIKLFDLASGAVLKPGDRIRFHVEAH